MIELCNFHTHTSYCDGKLTPEEMVEAAIARGCVALGFSGHSYTPFDLEYCMTREEIRMYIDEVNRLKEKYAGVIEIYLGIEQDYMSDDKPVGYDFVIGSAHYLSKDGEVFTIDAGIDDQRSVVDKYYGGDYYALAEDYFAVAANIATTFNVDIIGHFDLIAKYNINNSLFDETHPRYVTAALSAMERLLENCKLFEVNTGAMYKVGRSQPYPPFFLLEELQKRGGEVILSSDSHDAQSICFAFREMEERLKECGFRYVKRLSATGFVDVEL
ncbi:MAG: histidinol-phosphatase [Oscillospiraceae bacterium]|nr:histidinol-phosphatase [Oscillospiraceae bacterium]